MPKQRAVRSHLLSGLVVAVACSGCSLFISLDEIVADKPADGGGGTTVVSDGSASNDVSVALDANAADANAVDASVVDVSVGDAKVGDGSTGDRAVGNTDGGTISMRPDATGPMPGSDGGPDGGTCTNPSYPVSCPAMPDAGITAGCWSAGTDCSSIRNCGGTLHGCPARYAFDCALNQCILICNPTCSCTDPMYPVLCTGVGSPADGGTTTDCWTATTDCSTVTNCSGDYHACSTGFRYDCATSRCVAVADAGPRDAGDAAADGPRITCEAGLTVCGSRCVNLQTDVSSCGSCTNSCAVGSSCFAGQCCATPQAGGVCNVPACGCAAGSVCYPDTPATGLQCYVSGGLPNGADCRNTNPGACASGFGCFGGICAKYCSTDPDCPIVDQARSCVQTTYAGGANIPGILVCSQTCDPVTPQAPRSPLLPCPAGFGCFPDTVSPGASDCTPQGGAGVSGSACSTDANCAPGYFCLTTACVKWCSGDADCTGGDTCLLGLGAFAGTKEIGACQPP